MFVIILWIVFAFIVASYGKKRKIGFFMALIVSVIFSPLVGVIVVLLSEKNTETIQTLKISREANLISEEEYQRSLRKLIPSAQEESDTKMGFAAIIGVVLLIVIAFKCVG